MSPCACKQMTALLHPLSSYLCSDFIFWLLFSLCVTSPSCSRRVTFDILLMLLCFHVFFFSLPSTLTPQLTRSKCPPCPSDPQITYIYIFFFLICLCHSILVRLSICLSHSHIFFFFLGCLTSSHAFHPLLSPELWQQGLWCPVCGAGYCSFGLLSQPTKLCSHWPRGSCRVCNHPA